MLYDKSMLALDEGTGHIQLGVVRCGSCCTGRLSGAPPARPVRIVLARWFRCCRPIRLANALLLARVALGQRFGSRTAGLETLWELLHPSVFGAMPSRPVQIGLTRWFRCCRPCPSYQCFMTCPSCLWAKVRVAYSGACHYVGVTVRVGFHGAAVSAGPDCTHTLVSMLPPPSFSSMLHGISKLSLVEGASRVQRGVAHCGRYCTRRISRRCRHGWSRLYSHGGFAAAALDLLANAL
jgi:hypothetical protein